MARMRDRRGRPAHRGLQSPLSRRPLADGCPGRLRPGIGVSPRSPLARGALENSESLTRSLRLANSSALPGNIYRVSPSRRHRVSALYRLLDQPAAFGGRQSRVHFRALRLGRQLCILDGVPEPAGIVPVPEVVEPGLVIHPIRHLHEEHEVLGAEIQLAGGTPEEEALVLAQLTGGVLSDVTAMLR